MKDLTIGEAARQAGVGVETIRFYERRGLIEQPLKPRDSSFRIYSAEQLKRIKFIREAQRLGFSLKEIHELLALRADPNADCSMVQQQAVAKLGEVRAKIDQLHRIGSALEALIAVCPGCGSLEVCSILDTLVERSRHPAPRIGTEDPLPTATPKRAAQRNLSFRGNNRRTISKQRRAR